MTVQETIILGFLKDWLNWAKGKPSKVNYFAHAGLCHGCETYAFAEHGMDIGSEFSAMVLRNMFRADNLDTSFPFGYRSYTECKWNHSMHECPKRLVWVKATIKRLESKQ